MAFRDILPSEILWRKKEAMSDGISSTDRSWHVILQEYISENFNMAECEYYKAKFTEIYGAKFAEVIPHYWQPVFNTSNSKDGYIDPSARILDVYG